MTLRFEDLAEGQELPPLVIHPDVGDAVRFCAFAWVFPGLFYDMEDAVARGMPGTIVPGPLKMGAFLRLAEDWVGTSGFVRHVRAAHRQPDPSGRDMTVTGRVARVYEEDGHRRADLEMALLNSEGRPSVRGFATVELY